MDEIKDAAPEVVDAQVAPDTPQPAIEDQQAPPAAAPAEAPPAPPAVEEPQPEQAAAGSEAAATPPEPEAPAVPRDTPRPPPPPAEKAPEPEPEPVYVKTSRDYSPADDSREAYARAAMRQLYDELVDRGQIPPHRDGYPGCARG